MDVEIVTRVLAGEQDAFRLIIERYQRKVFSLALGHLGGDRDRAADAAQEVFVKVYRGLKTFQQQSKFSTWLHRVTVNHLITLIRMQKAKKRGRPLSLDAPIQNKKGDDLGMQVGNEKEEPTRRLVNEEAKTKIHQAIETLEEDLQSVVMLCDVQGLAYEETAEILAIPIGTVRSRLHRAREALRGKLKHLW